MRTFHRIQAEVIARSETVDADVGDWIRPKRYRVIIPTLEFGLGSVKEAHLVDARHLPSYLLVAVR
jgi:hypothetical protein